MRGWVLCVSSKHALERLGGGVDLVIDDGALGVGGQLAGGRRRGAAVGGLRGRRGEHGAVDGDAPLRDPLLGVAARDLSECLRVQGEVLGFDPTVLGDVEQPQEKSPAEEPLTARVADLCNGLYEVMLQVLSRYYAHHGETPAELERMTRRYTSEISILLGPDRDIPAPDVNTDANTMAWIYDTYDMMHPGKNNLPVVTGKPVIAET